MTYTLRPENGLPATEINNIGKKANRDLLSLNLFLFQISHSLLMSKTLNNKDISIINEYEHHQQNLLNISQINMWPLVCIAICFGLISKDIMLKHLRSKTKNKLKIL